jgi:hypothetical protein
MWNVIEVLKANELGLAPVKSFHRNRGVKHELLLVEE